MKSFVNSLAVIGVLVAGASAYGAPPASTCTPYFLMTGCPTTYDPCCKFNCIAAGGRGSTCLDYDDTRNMVICSACPGAPAATTTVPPPSKPTTSAASTCTPYFLMTGCPQVYDSCCKFNCIAAGGMGSTCLDFDDTRDQVICSECPGAPATTPAPTAVAQSYTNSAAPTCTPYFLMTGCPKVYDPCCAFNCIAAGGMGSTCLDFDDTRDQVICSACATAIPQTPKSANSDVSTRTHISLRTDIINKTHIDLAAAQVANSTTAAAHTSSHAGVTSVPHASGNVTTTAPPKPTNSEISGASAVTVSTAAIFGLLCVMFAL
ncbi:hypothetical protein H072_1617 [Dactylellina haptotyla CBS 200.50]|uniref:Uncharacterized protein n=1 Tax=Dactylellina haptotyla (strain CBS 200.50) TaxID=1284197 RepID=S8AN97_DACHA|nr:hypothetical protein H072_1617 [Dactylellina haptotyla CBS 200.50]